MKFIKCSRNEHVQALCEGAFQTKSYFKYVIDSSILTLLFTFKHFLNLEMWMFSVIAILEHLLLLEALKDSKISYLFLTDLVSVEFHRPQKKCLAIWIF